ncbi:MAG: grasp-with-spasm system SPASM domain peptide maturase [Taibaiella sp.]|nr:grasp-with-spasm system SPASM domain peptide maturase [Taibaiella sp.]
MKGAIRSVICDIERRKITFIPNELYSLISEFDKLSFHELLTFYGENNKVIVTEYLDFLLNNEYIFLCAKPELKKFPKIDLTYHTPSVLTNAIIELSYNGNNYLERIIGQLEQLQCSVLEIRIQDTISKQQFELLLKSFDRTLIKELFVVCLDPEIPLDEVKNLFLKYPRLSNVTFTEAENDEVIIDIEQGIFEIVYTKNQAQLPRCCGTFPKYSFDTNLTFFSEAQNFNTCLNKKISIDVFGNVKNCPSMTKIYGNIEKDSLLDIINNTEITMFWSINKDKIKVCQDCEFRYVCMDCRAYLESPTDTYSKPLKCGYNPYTGEWEEWYENPLKRKQWELYNLTM